MPNLAFQLKDASTTWKLIQMRNHSVFQLVKNVSKSEHPHPCPVPVELMERIIKLTTNEGDLVVDPFAGSGSTGVACVNTNRRFVGFEIDTLYSDMANERIADAIIKKEKSGGKNDE